MNVLITGGTGLIGRALAESLAGDGHRATLLSRRPQSGVTRPAGVQVAAWDGRSGGSWADLAHGADAIVNLAGENLSAGRWTPERKRRILESRIDAGKAVVEAVRAATRKPHVVIQASAVGYYGPHGAGEIPEDTPAGKDFLAGVAVRWEDSTKPVELMGVRRVVIRTGLPLTLQGGVLPRLRLPFLFFLGGPLGSGMQGFPWIHMADEIGAIRFLIETEAARGAFNLVAPNPPTNRAFTQALGRVMHRPGSLPVPAFALRLLLGEMATIVVTGQHAIPARLLRLGFVFKFTDLESALRDVLNG